MSALPINVMSHTKTLGIFGSDEWIVASEIGVDMQYQRPLNVGHVRKIAREFNLKAFGVLLVSERANGTYWIIDGQHRLAAVKAMGRGDMRLPCHVYKNLSVAEEAEIFHMQTQRKAISSVDRFRARLFAGDETAMSINRIIQKHGLHVEQNTRKGCMAAISAAERIYERHGAQRLDDVLSIAVGAWGDREDGIPGSVIYGLDAFLLRYDGAFDRDRLIRVLRSNDLERMTADAKALRSAMRDAGPDASFGRVIFGIYNRGLTTRRLPEWETAQSIAGRAAKKVAKP
jgi:hypothetical protein